MTTQGGDAILASVIRSSLDCIVVIDDRGLVLEFNPAAEATFGYVRSEVLGRPIADLIVPSHMREAHTEGFARYLAGGAPQVLGRRVEVEAVRSDGTAFPIELAITEARIGDRRLFTASIRDLTERRAAAAALQESEARLAAFLENAPAAMYLKDLEGRYVVANRFMIETLGTSAGKILGHSYAEVLGPAAVEAVRATDRALLESGAPQIGEAVFPTATGPRQTMAVRFPIRDADGRISHLGGVIIDISEQKRVEQQLRESQKRFQALSEFHPVALVIMRLSDRKVVLANPAFFELIGLPDADLDVVNSAPWYETPEEQEKVMAATAAYPAHTGYEARMRRVGGAFWASISWRHVEYDGEPAIVTAIKDITDRKVAEADLERSREALHQTEKLSALGSLLAGVSHELNNPLAVVVGEAIMLEEDAQGSPLFESATRIKRAADRCSRIVQTFLAMARQRPPKRQPVDAKELMRGAVDLTDYSLRSNGIKVNWDLDEDLPPIWGDPDQLHQVLVNILINACQALQESTRDRELWLRATHDVGPNLLGIEIADNGPGVPPDIARRIFDPFFTTKPQGAGTGIGLSFCQGIVEAHEGSLKLVSSSCGATFRIELPTIASPVGVSERVRQHSSVIPARKGAALVVDDEPDLALALARLVEREGYDVDIAAGGRSAKEKLSAQEYRVILSDLRMPDVDGPALYAWIGDERPGLLGRVAFVTGDTLGPGAIGFLTRTGRPFMSKPFTRESLRELLQKVDPDQARRPVAL